MTPDQTTQLQNYQSNVGSYDFTTLSTNGQLEVLSLMKGILRATMEGLTELTDPTPAFTATTQIAALKNNITPPQQITP